MIKRITACFGSLIVTLCCIFGTIGAAKLDDKQVTAFALQTTIDQNDGYYEYFIDVPLLDGMMFASVDDEEIGYTSSKITLQYRGAEIIVRSSYAESHPTPIQDYLQYDYFVTYYKTTETNLFTNNAVMYERVLECWGNTFLSTATHYPCYLEVYYYFEDGNNFITEVNIFGLPLTQDYYQTDDDKYYRMAEIYLSMPSVDMVRFGGEGWDFSLIGVESNDVFVDAYGYSYANTYRLRNYSLAYNNGYDSGYAQGRKDGYTVGYNDGHQVDPDNYSFFNLITSAIDVPVNAIISLFDFEFLGVNLANFFFSAFTIVVCVFILRWVLL